MIEIRCKVRLFTFERFDDADAPVNCVKYVDTIDEQYQMVSLTEEQYKFLMAKTDEEIAAANNPYARPDFDGLRDDFTEIFNGIAASLVEKMRRLFEEDGSAKVWINEAMRRIGVSVCQDCEEGEDDIFVTYEPICVKNGLIYNHPFGKRHIVSFLEDDEPFRENQVNFQ